MSGELIGILSVGVPVFGAIVALGSLTLSGLHGLRREMGEFRQDMQAGDEAIREEMRAGEARIEARIDRLEERMDARIDRVDERLRVVEHGMARIEGALMGPWPRREPEPPAEAEAQP